MNGSGEGMPDPEKIKEILDVVSEKVPSLLRELSEVLYSPEQARNFGVSIATFYKELKAAGMTDEEAFDLTRQYMSTLNIGSVMQGRMGHHPHRPGAGDGGQE